MVGLVINMLALGLPVCDMNASVQSSIRWTKTHDVEHVGDGYRVTGDSPWVIGEPTTPVPAENRFLLLTMASSVPANAEIRWFGADKPWSQGDPAVVFRMPGGTTTRAIDLGSLPLPEPMQIWVLPQGLAVGAEFQIPDPRIGTKADLTESQVDDVLDFRCVTSKLHYEPGDTVPWRASFFPASYPDPASSKILDIRILNEAGKTVVSAVDHYGLQAAGQLKELSGSLKLPDHLDPGRYRLEVVSTDQRSGRVMSSGCGFGVIGPDAPFMCETPFKFLADFSLIRDKQGLWHIFAITGDFDRTGSGWRPDGEARTFSHSTSTDLRHWTAERPVLSITDKTYPDGRGRYEDRNIWSPHIVCRDGRYYMFYTSVNQFVSQSISLAISDDLEHWTEYESNPVFTLEGVDWAVWQRDRWADCRDPVVFRDGDTFYLYVTAEAKTADSTRGGAVSVARSTDLLHWSAPEIALHTPYIPESPQVWKSGNKYYMTTSERGEGTWVSNDPVRGWEKAPFPRPPVLDREKYVVPAPGKAEEVVPLADGSFIVGTMAYRGWGGDSIYFFKMNIDARGYPAGYESPFVVKQPPAEANLP